MLEEETGHRSGFRQSEALELLTVEHQYIQAAREPKRARARKWTVQGRDALELLSTEEAGGGSQESEPDNNQQPPSTKHQAPSTNH
jgi:hypothetical protein